MWYSISANVQSILNQSIGYDVIGGGGGGGWGSSCCCCSGMRPEAQLFPIEVNSLIKEDIAGTTPTVPIIFRDICLSDCFDRVVIKEIPSPLGFDERHIVTMEGSTIRSFSIFETVRMK